MLRTSVWVQRRLTRGSTGPAYGRPVTRNVERLLSGNLRVGNVSFTVLERHVPIINVRRNGQNYDAVIFAQKLLNLPNVAAPNQLPQIAWYLKRRRGLGGRPMCWQRQSTRISA